MSAVLQLTGASLTVRLAGEAFLSSLNTPHTARSYGVAVGKTTEQIGYGRLLASIEDDEIGEALELLWGRSAVSTWNARRSAVLAWTGWCVARGYNGPAVPAWAKRRMPPAVDAPVRSKMTIDRLTAHRDIHLRERSLWRMLYETCASAEEILELNVEDLDLAGRRCPLTLRSAGPGARPRGAGQASSVQETVFWEAGTAHLLPRLLRGRTRGPVFVTHRRPGPGKVLGTRDVCPDTGLARLSYGQARALLDQHTASAGPGSGWELSEFRRSGLTHLGEKGASELMLMAKSRHRRPESIRQYFKPTAEAIAGVTSLLGPDGYGR